MGENDPELERLKCILEDPDAERELKVGRLVDIEFFSKTPERDGFLMRWFLDPRNTDPHVLFATNESLGRRIEGGAKYPEEVLCEVRDASESENPIAKQRALGVIKIMQGRLISHCLGKTYTRHSRKRNSPCKKTRGELIPCKDLHEFRIFSIIWSLELYPGQELIASRKPCYPAHATCNAVSSDNDISMDILSLPS